MSRVSRADVLMPRLPARRAAAVRLAVLLLRTRTHASPTCQIDEKGDALVTESDRELKTLKQSMKETQPVGSLVDSCRTLDQVFLPSRLMPCAACLTKNRTCS